jgi:hypothetical protein
MLPSPNSVFQYERLQDRQNKKGATQKAAPKIIRLDGDAWHTWQAFQKEDRL